MRYSFGIGDYSNDGHGRHEVYYCELKGDYTLEQIKEAYEKSREELGFGLENIADQYDTYLTKDQAQKIVDFGFTAPDSWEWQGDEEEVTLAEALCDNYDEEMWLRVFEMLVKKQLPEFQATLTPDNSISLFGNWNSKIIPTEFIGYGTLSH